MFGVAFDCLAGILLLFIPQYFMVYISVVIIGSFVSARPPSMILHELSDGGNF